VKKFLKIAGIAALAATLGVVAVGAVAFAQRPFGGPGSGPEQAGAHHEQMQQAMAEALGLTVEELDTARDEGKSLLEIAEAQGVDMANVEEAMRAAGDQLIDQAVADGLLTQEQADTIRQRWGDIGDRGPLGRLGLFPFFGNDQAEAYRERTQEALANALGLSVEEPDAARDEGKSLLEIAEAQGVDMADVQDALKTAGQERLDQAVADGTLTQEQADSIRQHMEDMSGEGMPNPEGPRGEGFAGLGGPGGFMQIISDATGLDIDSIRQQTADGATLAEIITANGGNVEEVKALLIESMSQMPNADETDIEQRVSDLLNNPMPQRGPGDGSGGRLRARGE